MWAFYISGFSLRHGRFTTFARKFTHALNDTHDRSGDKRVPKQTFK